MKRRHWIIFTLCLTAPLVGLFAYLREENRRLDQHFANMRDLGSFDTACVEHFVVEILSGRVDNAYEQTTKGFKARCDLQSFRRMMERYPVLENNKSWGDMAAWQGPGLGISRVTYVGWEDTMELRLIKVGIEWKVDDVCMIKTQNRNPKIDLHVVGQPK